MKFYFYFFKDNMTSITHNPHLSNCLYFLIRGVCSGGYFIYSSFLFLMLYCYVYSKSYFYTQTWLPFADFENRTNLLCYLNKKKVIFSSLNDYHSYIRTNFLSVYSHHFNQQAYFEKKKPSLHYYVTAAAL